MYFVYQSCLKYQTDICTLEIQYSYLHLNVPQLIEIKNFLIQTFRKSLKKMLGDINAREPRPKFCVVPEHTKVIRNT